MAQIDSVVSLSINYQLQHVKEVLPEIYMEIKPTVQFNGTMLGVARD